MTKLFSQIYFAIMFAPEGEGAGGSGDAPADLGSVLFPNDKPAGEQPEGTEPDGDAAPAEWKEYVADPNKSDEENAAAKAEHDKTKPKTEGDDKDKSAADQVPTDGKYDLKLPDGVALDQELLDALGPEFKEAGLTNGQAQKLAEAYTKVLQERSAKETEGWSNTVAKWVDDAKADKEIGGDKWDVTVAASQRAINKLGTPALKEYLEASGGGNHPELIRFASKVGAMIREDDPANGGAGGSSKPAEPAHVLFPSDAPKG